MPNPSGANNFLSTGYGDVKRRDELARSAPMSGAPVATAAREAPRRAQKQAQRPRSAGSVPTPEQLAEASVTPPMTPDYRAQVASVWQQLAATPGADDLVQQYAAEADQQATR